MPALSTLPTPDAPGAPDAPAMQDFQRGALLAFVLLLAASLALGLACHRRSILDVALLPGAAAGAGASAPWLLRPGGQASADGHADVHLLDDGRRLHIDLQVASDGANPFAAANLFFVDRGGNGVHVDLSPYDTISFIATCTPANTLSLAAPMFEQGISRHGDLLTYRAPMRRFACSERGSRVVLDLTRMETPQSWLARFGLDLSHRAYRLDQVAKLAVGTTLQSPRDVDLAIDLSAIALHGRAPRWLALCGATLLLAWTGFGLWCVRARARALVADLQARRRKDLPIMAHRQLALAPCRDRDKTALLRTIASRYTDAELDLDAVAHYAGVDCDRVDAILWSELGFTFTGYLNKLRLTEAARLLLDERAATVPEVAYTVGYNNVAYFTRLFREEYGCSPMAFRRVLSGPGANRPDGRDGAMVAAPAGIERVLRAHTPG